MGRKRKAKEAKAQKPKTVNVELLERKEGKNLAHPYKLLDRLVAQHHDHLEDAKILICWKMSDIREDSDGMAELIKVSRAGDFDRALAEWDFAFIINHHWWNKAGISEDEMLAALDFGCCHCMPVNDKDDSQKVDEAGRLCWRLRKPFKIYPENLRRFGLWQPNYESVGKAIRDADRPLLPPPGEDDEDEAAQDAAGSSDSATAAKPAETTKPAKAEKAAPKAAPSAADPSQGGTAWPKGKVPAIVKLTGNVAGYDGDDHGLVVGVEFPVSRVFNGKACITTLKGELYQLEPSQYSVRSWQKPESVEQADPDHPSVAGKVGSAA